MLVPERGEPTTKTGLFVLLCILLYSQRENDRLYNQCATFARILY